MEDSSHFKSLQIESRMHVPLECILISFMKSEDVVLARFAAHSIARLAVSKNGELTKRACEELGGIPALLKWAIISSSEELLESVTMAICNISTRPENQVIRRL